jgi:hypothetical protein
MLFSEIFLCFLLYTYKHDKYAAMRWVKLFVFCRGTTLRHHSNLWLIIVCNWPTVFHKNYLRIVNARLSNATLHNVWSKHIMQ